MTKTQSTPKTTPNLRFPEFRDVWKTKNLIDLSKNGFSNGVFNDPTKVGSGYKLINVKDMYTEGFINENILSLVAIDKKEFKRNNVEKGDLFFTRSSLVKEGIAYSNIYLGESDDVTYDGHLIRMQPNTNIVSSIFLYYLLKTSFIRRQLVARGNTTTMTTIGQADISNVETITPKIQEQQKIAGLLITVDDKVATLQKKVDLLKKYKKGVMQQIFTQQLRFKPVQRSLGEVGDENGNDFPDWEEKKLGDIADVRDGTHDSPKYIEKGIPLVTSKNLLSNGKLDLENISYISSEDFNIINKRSKVNIGDILFGMIGTIGNPVRVESNGFAIKNVALIKEHKKLKNEYLIHYLKSSHVMKQFHTDNAGGTQKFIALGVIRNFKLYIPSITEQQQIAGFFSAIDDIITLEERKLEQAKRFKKSLLQQMFV